MPMHIRFYLLVGFLSLLRSMALHGYIEGYDRLSNPKIHKVVDVLYDDHIIERGLSFRDMKSKPVPYIEQRLFKTEKQCMSSLRTLNKTNPGQVDLVWEHGLGGPDRALFIGFSDRLVKEQFPNLNWIASDICRDAFEILLFDDHRSSCRSHCGVSVKEPLPIPDERHAAILKNSGELVLKEFKTLHTKTSQRCKGYFSEKYFSGISFNGCDVDYNKPFDALADVELISHILASDKPHVIVYAGGWHSDKIVRFLQKVGYTLVSSVHSSYGEIPSSALKLIEQRDAKSTHLDQKNIKKG